MHHFNNENAGNRINPCVRNEFGTLKTAIISPISNPDVYEAAAETTSDALIREALHTQITKHPDITAHAKLRSVLLGRGVQLHYPHHPNLTLTSDTLKEWMGGDIYCHDFIGVVDTHAISSRVVQFRNTYRQNYERIVRKIPTQQHTHTNERFTWGDGLLVGDHLLVGLEHNDFFGDIQKNVSKEQFERALESYSERSAGISAIRSIVQQIQSTRSILMLASNVNSDLDISLAPLPSRYRGEPRRAIIREEGFHPASEEALYSVFDELIPFRDSWKTMGCNILWLDPETPLVPAEARHTISDLQSLGYNVQVLPMHSLLINSDTGTSNQGEPGGWRCLTGVLERANDYNFD